MSTTPRILVIADDLTGAAELAGILTEFGLPTRVLRTGVSNGIVASGIPHRLAESSLVIDTDSRHCSSAQAAEKVRFALKGVPLDAFTLIYKKTDSLLRGNVTAEIDAVKALTGNARTLLLPQNPSKGRIIRDGHYFIDHVPLDETGFRLDPEHPRTSSWVAAILAPADLAFLEPGVQVPSAELTVGNAASFESVARFAAILPTGVLPAGGADFFRAILQKRIATVPAAEMVATEFPQSRPASPMKLILLGSASAYSRATTQQWITAHLPVFSVPNDFSSNPSHEPSFTWQSEILAALLTRRLAILAITADIDAARALHYRQSFATVLHVLLTSPELLRTPLHLYIEGGATAAAALDTLNWTELAVLASLAPGVVTLRPAAAPHITLTIKPGSYPWPPRFPA